VSIIFFSVAPFGHFWVECFSEEFRCGHVADFFAVLWACVSAERHYVEEWLSEVAVVQVCEHEGQFAECCEDVALRLLVSLKDVKCVVEVVKSSYIETLLLEGRLSLTALIKASIETDPCPAQSFKNSKASLLEVLDSHGVICCCYSYESHQEDEAQNRVCLHFDQIVLCYYNYTF
jgi:hypothetical protein